MKNLIRLLCCIFITLLFAQLASAETDKPKVSQKAQNEQINTSFSSLGFVSPGNVQTESQLDEDKKEDGESNFINSPLPVFGQNLFGSQCTKLHLAHFFNPDYRIAAGDHINVKMWGAFQFDKELEVDAQGNIFIPEIGPIRVIGITNSNLNTLIQSEVNKVFKRDVNSYTDLVTSQPVQVYVTGYVNAPGLYDGLSSDSIIFFLCAANGINPLEGSYRNIDIVRNNQVIHTIDLYRFLLEGKITPIQLHQGDTIVVKAIKYTLSVQGAVKNPYQYEWKTPTVSMTALRAIANIEPSVTHVRIQRNGIKKPILLYQNIHEANKATLLSGDSLTFVVDKNLNEINVTVKGQVENQHKYVLKKGTRLDELMKKIKLKKEANPKVIQLFRPSVAAQQKDGVDATLSRYEREVLTSAPQTDEEAKIQTSQSEMIVKFIDDAKKAKMKGQIVLGDRSTWHKIILEDNDVINIPAKTSVVTISGEVVNAVSIEKEANFKLFNYVKAAGGLTDRADPNQVLLIKQSGQVHLLKYRKYYQQGPKIEGGDEIIVLAKVIDENWRKASMLTKLVYQLAVAAKVFLLTA